MNIIFIILISIVCFLAILIGGKKYRTTTLYALAIGGAVNSNFFHSQAYPINCFGLSFGIDSVIYALFIFCIIVMFLQYGKSQAYTLLISSVVAIAISATFQLLAELLSNGSTHECWLEFSDFIISAITTLIITSLMIEIISKLKEKGMNSYFIIAIGSLFSIIINTVIYYGILTLLKGSTNTLLTLILTSYIGKAIGLACSLLAYYLLTKYDNRKQATKPTFNESLESEVEQNDKESNVHSTKTQSKSTKPKSSKSTLNNSGSKKIN